MIRERCLRGQTFYGLKSPVPGDEGPPPIPWLRARELSGSKANDGLSLCALLLASPALFQYPKPSLILGTWLASCLCDLLPPHARTYCKKVLDSRCHGVFSTDTFVCSSSGRESCKLSARSSSARDLTVRVSILLAPTAQIAGAQRGPAGGPALRCRTIKKGDWGWRFGECYGTFFRKGAPSPP